MGYTPPYLEVRKVTGGWYALAPSSTTSDDLRIYPNTACTYPFIKLDGDSAIFLYCSGGANFQFWESTTNILNIEYNTPDLSFTCPVADKNISLVTTGAGVVKFGTYTAGAATDSTGYITILDSAGNTRKLMVQA